MYKIHIKGNNFYIDNLVTTERGEAHAKNVLPRVLSFNSDEFSFNNVNNWDRTKVIKFSEIDLTGADYTDVASFIDWYEQNTGKSSPSAGGGAPIDLSNYVTKDTNEVITARKVLDMQDDKGGLIFDMKGTENGITFLNKELEKAVFIVNYKGGAGIDIKNNSGFTGDTLNVIKYMAGVPKQVYNIDADGNLLAQAITSQVMPYTTTASKIVVTDTDGVFKAYDKSHFWIGDNSSLSQNIDGIYDLDDLTVTGSYRPSNSDAGLPFGIHSQVAHYAHPYTNDFGFQIASAYSSNRVFFRNKRNGTWYDWSEIYHKNNAHRTTGLDDPSAADLNSLFPLAENPVGVQVVCTGARKSLYVRTGDTEWRVTELRLVS